MNGWGSVLRGMWNALDERNIGLIAAGIAFWGMLALFPAMAAVVAIWGLMADPVVLEEQLQTLAQVVPAQAFDIIRTQAESLISASPDALGWATLVSLMTALWSTRSGVAALIRGLNAIYEEPNRGGVRHFLAGVGVTVSLIGVALVALSTVVVVPIVLSILPLTSTLTETLIDIGRWTVSILVVVAGLGVVYRYGPNRRGRRTRWVTPGLVLAVLVWAVVSAAFSIYLANFGGYNKIYGSIGAVIALMMWLYITAYVTLLGAALNVELERAHKAATDEPET